MLKATDMFDEIIVGLYADIILNGFLPEKIH
jgi:hypothetical protein